MFRTLSDRGINNNFVVKHSADYYINKLLKIIVRLE